MIDKSASVSWIFVFLSPVTLFCTFSFHSAPSFWNRKLNGLCNKHHRDSYIFLLLFFDNSRRKKLQIKKFTLFWHYMVFRDTVFISFFFTRIIIFLKYMSFYCVCCDNGFYLNLLFDFVLIILWYTKIDFFFLANNFFCVHYNALYFPSGIC